MKPDFPLFFNEDHEDTDGGRVHSRYSGCLGEGLGANGGELFGAFPFEARNALVTKVIGDPDFFGLFELERVTNFTKQKYM